MKEKDRSKTQSKLPINIEEATRQYVQDNLAAWDDEILALRARRLGLSKEQAAEVDPTPLYLLEAKQRADSENRTLDSVLAEYSSELQTSNYPGPDCLLLHEVRDYLKHGNLYGKRLSHATECEACANVLAASLPRNLEQIFAIPDWVNPGMRLPLAAAATAQSAQGSEIGSQQSRKQKDTRDRMIAFKKVLAVGMPAAGIFAIAYFAIWKSSKPSDWPITAANAELVWLPAIAGLFAYFISFLGFKSVPKWRGIANGTVVGLVLGGYLYLDALQNKTIAETTFRWDQAEKIAMESIHYRYRTGAFLAADQITRIGNSQRQATNVIIAAPTVSEEKARYVLTGGDLSGQMTVDIGPNGGSLIWGDGDKVLKTITFLTGTVETATDASEDSAVQEKDFVANGRRYKCPSCALVPNADVPVVAAINPATSHVESYLEISKLDVRHR
jgi:hypothetical protein